MLQLGPSGFLPSLRTRAQALRPCAAHPSSVFPGAVARAEGAREPWAEGFPSSPALQAKGVSELPKLPEGPGMSTVI